MGKRKELKNAIVVGKLTPIGDGELEQALYYKGHYLGVQYGSNGTQGDEPYMPTVNDFVDSLSDKEVDEIYSMEVEYYCCPYCGEPIIEKDTLYEDENPNGYSIAYHRAIEEHEKWCKG